MDSTSSGVAGDRIGDRRHPVIEPQVWVELESFEQRVRAAFRSADLPLGGYACVRGVHYVFLGSAGAYVLSRRLDAERRTTAFSQWFPLLSWDEREMRDESGVDVENLPDDRPLRGRGGAMPAAVLAHGVGLMHMVVGPVHAGIIEPGRFTISSGGETVVHLDAQLSYSHRGVEPRLAGMPALDAARFLARICGSCSAARSYAYAHALETLANVDIDERTNLARVIIAELERIYNHLADLAACAAGAGWGPGFAKGMALKERAMRLCHLASGHRLLFEAIVPGGVSATTLRDPARLGVELRTAEAAVEAYLKALFGNTSLLSRWHRTGIVTHDAARAFGAVGPTHRAAKGEIDVRAFAPYGAYRQFPVKVAHATSSDVFARCRVKRDEIGTSFHLIHEALAQLGGSPPPPPRAFVVRPGTAIGVVEGPRGAETVAAHVDENGHLERLHVISASYRNWPLVARAMDGNIIPDFPLVNKSFNLCYACVDR
ncbi:MAG: hydrogenase large subunit [Vulcanimicrobiaceae bacterium]